MTTAREDALKWKKDSILRIRSMLGVLREYRKNLDKVCNGVKSLVTDVNHKAEQAARRYDRDLNEEDENYSDDQDAMMALQELPSADEEADDAKLQAGEALEGLISHLEEILSTVRDVKL